MHRCLCLVLGQEQNPNDQNHRAARDGLDGARPRRGIVVLDREEDEIETVEEYESSDHCDESCSESARRADHAVCVGTGCYHCC